MQQDTGLHTEGIDPREFRNALGCFPTGVTIITTLGPHGECIGITANSFNSVSMDPPLILFSLGRKAYSMRAFLATDHFAVNVLSLEQLPLSDRFAKASENKWAEVNFELWDSGCPILPSCAANFECRTEHTYDGGDHVIFVGRVIRLRHDPAIKPLLFHQGKYRAVENPA
jgi:flavin reductase (DIM6/NTAB) family NADH-FMN oxidoreductase RutF